MAINAKVLELLSAFTAEVPCDTIEKVSKALRSVNGPMLDRRSRLEIQRGLQPVVRAKFDELIDAWQSPEVNFPLTEMAAALEASAAQAAHLRSLGGVELVWTGPTLPTDGFRSTEQVLLEVIRASRESLYIVTFAAYKIPVLSQAIGEALNRGVRVVFVLESRSESEGRVSFDPSLALTGDVMRGADFYVWPQECRTRNDKGQYGTLHAKFVVADKNLLFVSSANLTSHALNLNIELGVLIRGGTEPERIDQNINALIQHGIFRSI